jgi:hypothetical protein
VPNREEGAVPETTITIDREQRAGLYEAVCNHLSGLGDIWLALEVDEDTDRAIRICTEFVEDVWLLEDIGWGREVEPQEFGLTLKTEVLARVLIRLRAEAEEVLAASPEDREAREQEAATERRFQAAASTCSALLAELGPTAEA